MQPQEGFTCLRPYIAHLLLSPDVHVLLILVFATRLGLRNLGLELRKGGNFFARLKSRFRLEVDAERWPFGYGKNTFKI